MKKAGLLAAGHGVRLKPVSPFKPLVKINGVPLLELTLKNLQFNNFEKIVLIFNDEEREMDFTLLPTLETLKIDYFFKTTPSSMHSLYEVGQKLDLQTDEHFFISMVDSIVRPHDAERFYQFCLTLNHDESAIMVTPFIEDECPLTVKVDSQGYITEFQCPVEKDVLVTSGVYCLSSRVLPLLSELIEKRQQKMRTFLMELIKHRHKIRCFIVSKTLDIDRPEDVQSAEAFLGQVGP
ncbi:MAG: hypothetical protein A2X86_10910 [Bdellovibrionales bacterium GWA2_49_15]|nr:MAG: hypothetical protein A2X86_10910 [Bdellovibrionales bacterium GWA2_49_15]HAZ11486.1 hypothetical protein [Bdellovibrionales bacterium]